MKLRVVIVAPWGERLGGAEEMLWQLLAHRDPSRFEPTVIFLGPGPFETEVAELGISTHVFPAGRLRGVRQTARTIGGIAALLRRAQPDLVLNWSAKSQLYGSMAAVAAGMRRRVIWWQHQIPNGHWMDRLATLLPARSIGCSSRACQLGQSRLLPRRPSFVVHPGIELSGSHPGDEGLRGELGIPSGDLVAGIVGRLQPWKGQDRFLAALADLRRRGIDVHGLIVGGDAYDLSPRYASGLRQMVADLGLVDHVTFTGQVADAAPYLALMDVAVNASVGEPFGIVLLEAMAAGVPVVAVGEGGPVDIVEPGVTGLLAQDGEPATLADAMAELLRHPARREEMAAQARAACERSFTARRMSEQVVDRLLEVAGA